MQSTAYQALSPPVDMRVSRFFWHGHEIRVRSALRARYGFMATDTWVVVDGQVVGRSGGWGLVEHAHGTFRDRMGQAHTITARLQVTPLTVWSIPTTVFIDGQAVARGELPIENVGDGVFAGFSLTALVAGFMLLL